MNEYDELVSRHQSAYAAHEQMYRQRLPPPVELPYEEIEARPVVERLTARNRWAKLGLLLMTLASIVVSASRTVPEFGGGLIGIAAFCMVEVGIMTFAYLHTRMHADTRHVGRYVKLGIILTLALAVAANFNHEAGSKLTTVLGTDFSSVVNVLILILIGIGAPLLAYINGDVLALLTAQDEAAQQASNHETLSAVNDWTQRKNEYNSAYRQALELWRDGLNEHWDSQQRKKTATLKVEREVPKALPAETPDEPVDRAAFIRQLLSDPANASLWDMAARPLAQHITETYGVSVSKSLVNNVRNELRGNE